MKFSLPRAGLYLLLTFSGWAAGRWIWPPSTAQAVDQLPESAFKNKASQALKTTLEQHRH